jgi:hypothetical protein
VDSLPTIRSQGGRDLVAAGGIFPDLTVPYDTLTLKERDLLQTAAEGQIPLPLRIAEFGFSEAQALTAAEEGPRLREDAFVAFLDSLVAQGLSSELLEDPEVRGYLAWRARISVADRMDRLGSSAQVRMERDTVLAQAVQLLRDHPTQSRLFAEAQRLAAAAGVERPAEAGSGSGGR